MSERHPAGVAQVLAGRFFKAGCLTFGGGSATTAELHNELVTNRGLLDESGFQLCYTLSRITPGTNSLAFCVGAGLSILGWPGALIAILSVSLPSAAIVVLLTHLYEMWSNNPLAVIAMRGILAATTGIIAASAWVLVRPSFVSGQWVRVALFVAGAIALNVWLSLSPLQVLAVAALAGLLIPGTKNA